MILRGISATGVLVLTAVVLSGCFENGGDTSLTTTTTIAPGPTTTTTATTTPPNYGAKVKVVNYNLYWWCVSGNPNNNPEIHNENCARYKNGEGFKELFAKIGEQKPFDLIGFSEDVDTSKIMTGIGMADKFEAISAPPQSPGVNDAGMAWSKDTFDALGKWNADLMATDQYGNRFLTTQRLKVKSTGQTLLFANTHGALVHCDGALGLKVASNFFAAIAKYREPADSVIVTGDFNCLPSSTQMTEIGKNFSRFTDNTMHYDNIIYSNWMKKEIAESKPGAPSDHSIISAEFSLPVWPNGKVVPDPPTPGVDPSSMSKCAVLGCDKHDDTCWCTESCISHNSCCPDYKDVCGKSADTEIV